MQIEFTKYLDPVGKPEVVDADIERLSFTIDNIGRQMMKVIVNERDDTVYIVLPEEDGTWQTKSFIDIYDLYKFLLDKIENPNG